MAKKVGKKAEPKKALSKKVPLAPKSKQTRYDIDATFAVICERIAGGEDLRYICSSDDMPSFSQVYEWMRETDARRTLYARAREAQATYLVEESAHRIRSQPLTNHKGDIDSAAVRWLDSFATHARWRAERQDRNAWSLKDIKDALSEMAAKGELTPIFKALVTEQGQLLTPLPAPAEDK